MRYPGIPEREDFIQGELYLRLRAHQGDEEAKAAVARIDKVRDETILTGLYEPGYLPPNLYEWLEVHVAVPTRKAGKDMPPASPSSVAMGSATLLSSVQELPEE